MKSDDLPLALKSGSHLNCLMVEDLDPYSVEDLQARIESLGEEISRVKSVLELKKSRLNAAEALFSFKAN